MIFLSITVLDDTSKVDNETNISLSVEADEAGPSNPITLSSEPTTPNLKKKMVKSM